MQATMNLNDAIRFEFCDFRNSRHVHACVELINHYICDPMGGGNPLGSEQKKQLIEGLASNPSYVVLFILQNNTIVGLATYFVNFSTFAAAKYINIHDLIIHSSHRKKGLGKKLLLEIIAIAQALNYCKVTLEVRSDNSTAQSLYASLGFTYTQPSMLFWAKYLDTTP